MRGKYIAKMYRNLAAREATRRIFRKKRDAELSTLAIIFVLSRCLGEKPR